AGELVRILVDAPFRRRDANLGEQLHGTLAGLAFAEVGMRADRLDQLPPDGVERVEAGQRVLEDHAYLAAADLPDLVIGQVVDAPPAKPHLAAGDPARRLEQAADGRAGQRLAGARLAAPAPPLAPPDA